MKLPDPLIRVKDAELIDWIEATNILINTGHYEFPLTVSVPTYRSNDGEQRVFYESDGTNRRLYIYINGVWNYIGFNADGTVAGSGFGDRILDSDQNTGIYTQFVAGEERLRHYSNGTYVLAIDTYGVQVAPTYKIVFDGLGGGTYWTYSSASSYLQCYLNGSLRMEM